MTNLMEEGHMNLASLVMGLIVLAMIWLSVRSLIKERKTDSCS